MKIRPECFLPASDGWLRPSGMEIRKILTEIGQLNDLIDKSGNPRPLSGSETAKLLGLGPTGGRTVRRWTSEDSDIPFAAWATLCAAAGYGHIWKVESAVNHSTESD